MSQALAPKHQLLILAVFSKNPSAAAAPNFVKETMNIEARKRSPPTTTKEQLHALESPQESTPRAHHNALESLSLLLRRRQGKHRFGAAFLNKESDSATTAPKEPPGRGR
jgi:hypothetical protein